MASSIAIIQLIGLFVVSGQWTPGRLVAVAPRVDAVPHEHSTARARNDELIVPPAVTVVEPHQTIIAFETCSYKSSFHWAPSALESAEGLLFVRLDGERVTFRDSNAPPVSLTAKPAATKAATKAGATLSDDSLKLPHLQNCFQGMTGLKSEYLPPPAGSGTGIAAIIELPSGATKGCKGVTPTADRSRIDTQVDMSVTGDLIISVVGQNKQIKLAGNAHVLIANIEASFIDNSMLARSAPHHEVYVAMGVGGTDNGFGCAKQLSQDPKITECVPSSFTVIDSHTPSARVMSRAIGDLASRIDFECSNSQWP